MATAVLHLTDVTGYIAPARTYILSPGKDFGDGIAHEYVSVWIQPRFAHQSPEVNVVAATDTGASAYPSVHRRPGTHVLHDEPDTPESVAFAYAIALKLLGYDLETP